MEVNNNVVLQWFSGILPYCSTGNSVNTFNYVITLNKVFIILHDQHFYQYFYDCKGGVTQYNSSCLQFLQFIYKNQSPEHKISFIIIGT